jgi:hypothetical protein
LLLSVVPRYANDGTLDQCHTRLRRPAPQSHVEAIPLESTRFRSDITATSNIGLYRRSNEC